jgi:hypothetical protein
MLRVNFQKFDLCVSSICIICGAPFLMEHVEAVLYEGDKFIGNVCKECVKKGHQDFSTILKKHAHKLRDQVTVVEELLKQEFFCPPWEDYQKVLPAEKRDLYQEQKTSEEIRKITMQRMLLIGEGVVPREEMEGLTSKQINIFLKEPDPGKWPPEISHLKKYADIELDIQTFLRPEEEEEEEEERKSV